MTMEIGATVGLAKFDSARQNGWSRAASSRACLIARLLIPRYEIVTGSRIRLVRMITATPSDAPMANSRITPISISSSVTKPTASEASATMPGMNSWRNAIRAAASGSSVSPEAMAIPLIFCTPWEMPMAKTRNGTSIE